MILVADPEHLAMARNFGILLLLLLLPALSLRVTYFRGLIRRDDDPRDYWVAVGLQAALGAFLVVTALLKG